MVEAVLELVASDRFDVAYALIGVVASVCAAISALALTDRIIKTRQAPFAYARAIAVLIIGIGVLVTQAIALGAFNDAGMFETRAAPRALGWIVIGIAVLIASLFRAEEDDYEDPAAWMQVLGFGVLAVVMHQGSILPRLIEDWDAFRIQVAVATGVLAVAMVLPFARLFSGRAFTDRSAVPAGILMGLALSLPFLLGNLLLYAGQAGDARGISPAQDDERVLMVISGLAFLATIHAIGWVLAWRASVREDLARREVRVLEASLHALLDDSPDWVSVLDEKGRILASGGIWNRGPVRHRLKTGDSMFEALDPDLRADLRGFFEEARRTPSVRVVREIHYFSPDGDEETTELRLVDRTDDPQVRGVILVARSRTEQIAQQVELENQRRIYLEIFERAPLPMFIIDAVTHRFVDVNPAVVTMYGYAREEMLGREAEFIVSTEHRDQIWEFREAIHRGQGDRVDMIADHVRADGSTFEVRVVGTQFRDAGDLRRIVMVQDVSSFVREGNLRSGEIQLLQKLAGSEDIASYLTAMVDWLGDFPLGEQQLSALWLDPQAPLIASAGLSETSTSWLATRSQDDLARVLAGDEPACFVLGDGDAERVWALGVRDGSGTLLGVVASGPCIGDGPDQEARGLLEIAARLTALAAEREMNGKVLQHAQRMETLGRVAGGVAHDFNNLLTVILGEADLLREAPEIGDESRANVASIMESAGRASTIARRLLSMSRNQPQRHEQIVLNEVVAEANQWMRGVLGEATVLEVSAPADPLVSVCDRSLLESSLLNLAINGRDAMDGAGRLEMTLSRETLASARVVSSGSLAAGDYAVFRITDQGPGIPAAVLPRVLDPFFTTRAGAGTGLGLPMVANFATDNGGGLDVRNRAEGGAEVNLLLPLAAVDSARSPAAAGPGGRRILVVEDEPLVGRFVTRSLVRQGYEVDLLDTADEACERLAGGARYDLVLSDIGLPGKMDGVDLARWIAAERPDLVVLLSSGYASEGLADDIDVTMLPKPYDARTLIATVASLLPSGAPEASD